jgi:hypothetical protein
MPPVAHNIYGTLPSSHSRTPSDPIMPLSASTGGFNHKRSPSSDSGTIMQGFNSLSAQANNRGSMPSGIHLGNDRFFLFDEKQFFNALCLVGAKLVLPTGEIPQLKTATDKFGLKISVQRPQNPPPPTPTTPNQVLRLSNGRSTESINSGCSDLEAAPHTAPNINPVPPPRRVSGFRSVCFSCCKATLYISDTNILRLTEDLYTEFWFAFCLFEFSTLTAA